jgi:quercetin dioxygenase-like cupin family protein
VAEIKEVAVKADSRQEMVSRMNRLPRIRLEFERGDPMKAICRLLLCSLFLVMALPGRTSQQQAFRVKTLLEKDISSYAGGDILLSVGEITLAPGATGTRHRHPGPTFVYVLAGAVEVELEGAPATVYHVGETFYEEPQQLHISTKNVSTTEPARILAYHLSHKGEPLTQPEK